MDMPVLTSPSKTIFAAEERVTFDEFLTKYAGVHAEWHPDGTVEIIVTQNRLHTTLIFWMHTLLSAYFDIRPIGIVVGTGLVLKNAGFSGREPDLTVLLGEKQAYLHDTYIEGVPDILVEVVSPESTERDYEDKYDEYEQLGVTEYWIIDPKRKVFDIHERGADGHYSRRANDRQNRVTSGILAGFALSADALWRDKLPSTTEILGLVAGMTGTDITITPSDG